MYVGSLYEGLNEVANEIVWIGVDERKDIGQHIPNFYKFAPVHS